MIGLLRAELRKLATVRSTWAITAIGLLLVLGGAAPTAFGTFAPFTGSAAQTADVFSGVGGASVIPLIVSLLAITTEFRHGTIGRTLQLTPSRTRVIAVKGAAAVVFSVVFATLGVLLSLAIGLIGAAQAGVGLTFGGAVVEVLWQAYVALGLTALLGVAFGALVRSQALALAVALIWIFIGETLVGLWRPEVGRYLPFSALNALFVPADQAEAAAQGGFAGLEALPPLVALGTFLAWVVVLSASAIAAMRYRDV